VIETIVDPYETGRNARNHKRVNQVHRIGRVGQETAGWSLKIEIEVAGKIEGLPETCRDEARYEEKEYWTTTPHTFDE
jgi:hypothetical protein